VRCASPGPALPRPVTARREPALRKIFGDVVAHAAARSDLAFEFRRSAFGVFSPWGFRFWRNGLFEPRQSAHQFERWLTARLRQCVSARAVVMSLPRDREEPCRSRSIDPLLGVPAFDHTASPRATRIEEALSFWSINCIPGPLRPRRPIQWMSRCSAFLTFAICRARMTLSPPI